MTQRSTATDQAHGHHWKETARVVDFVEQSDREAAERAEIHGLLVSLLPFEESARLRVLDIGSGHGILAGAILDAFPNAHAVGLDISEPMMEMGRERMARFGDRFRYHVGDFASGTLPAELSGPFDLVVSSRAIHHLPPESKRKLYAEVFEHLEPGGCFVNIDNMRPHDDFLRERYRVAADRERAARGEAPVQRSGQGGSGREFPDPVGEQLGVLRDVGFQHVECFWKRMTRAMIGGFR